MDITGSTANRQRGAKIKTKIYCTQMRHRMTSEILFQGTSVGTEQIDLVSQTAALHGNNLPAVISQETFQFGKLLQKFRILGDAGGNFLKIVRCGSRIGIGTGQQKCVQLLLGSRNRNDFDNILFFGVLSKANLGSSWM